MTTGCGAATSAAGPVDTIVDLQERNYQSIAPVTAAPTTVPSTAPTAGQVTTEETTYTVKANDSLGLIAKKYKLDVATLQKHNGFSSPNPTIHPGDPIKIPAGATLPGTDTSSDASSSSSSSSSSSESSSQESTGSDSTAPSSGAGCTYTVVAGDNPSKIAKKTGIEVAEFTKANEASGVLENLLIGSKVIIPAPGKCP